MQYLAFDGEAKRLYVTTNINTADEVRDYLADKTQTDGDQFSIVVIPETAAGIVCEDVTDQLFDSDTFTRGRRRT